MRNTKLINISGVIAIIVLIVLTVGYLLNSQWKAVKPAASVQTSQAKTGASSAAETQDSGNPFLDLQTSGENSVLAQIEEPALHGLEIIIRLTVAVLLAALLAFRPRKNIPLFRRNLYVAQTQILLAVVAAALMMIVGDNAARAFAIFAAVSLVRFRTNIRDPKEITVLLISLALGLAAGVGRWDLGLVLCLFALVLLWILEFREPEQVTRSMELKVKTDNTDSTHDSMKKIFDRYSLEAEVRQIDAADADNPSGCIMYYVNLPLNLSTDFLSDKIFAANGDKIDSIEWKQKKNTAYIYQ